MKLNKIEISNVIGIGRADLDMTKAVMVISADNAAGKSSIADAISMAMIGKPCRVNAKKDLGQLLHNGAEKGRVSIMFDDTGEGAEFRLPKGEHHVNEFAGSEFVPFVLDPSLFARLRDDERRTMLYKLTSVKASAKLVGEKLEARGISQEVIDEILPLMRGGFPAASKEAYARATQAKGQWRGITGGNWGAVVAEGWKAPKPEGEVPAAKHLEELLAKVGKHQADLEDGIKFIGQQEEALKASAGRVERIATLTETAGLLKRRETKLKTDQAELDAWEEKFPSLKKTLDDLKAAGVPVKCPCCDEDLSIVGGTLQKFAGLKADTKAISDAALAVTNARGAIDLLKSAISHDQAAIAESKSAAEEVERLKEEGGASVDAEKLERSREAVAKLRQTIADLRVDFNAKQEARSQAAKVDELTAKATAAHEQVKAWNAAGDALAPDGIPGDLLNDALAPVNQSIAVLSGMCGWNKAVVEADMSITYGGRLYGLCSESEKWRADALIALAIAQISQLRMVLLDRFDVLDSPSRQRLLGMLLKLDRLGAMDTMIICGTMKQAMPASDDYSSVWIINGLAETVTA
ncbi:chromosome segregation protein [compost metagenome]